MINIDKQLKQMAAEAAAMIDRLTFTYTHEQWNKIKTVVRDRLGRDADQIERLRRCIEHAASIHIPRSALGSQTRGHKARIKQLTTLLDRTEALGADIIDALAPSFTIEDMLHRPFPRDATPLVKTERAIATLVSVIDASIAVQRPQQNANSRKAGRDRFWEEMLAIWTSIGGAETGTAAAKFIVATSKPVFDRVLAIGGHKTAASMPQDYDAVEAWLRLRAKARRTATP
jgi:hypothetical protein